MTGERPLRGAPSRSATARELSVELAQPADNAQIAELLRRNPLGGEVLLSLERQPDFRLAAGVEGYRHHTLVLREAATRRVLGMCSRAVRRVWVNGAQRNLGYLGQLRRHPALTRRMARLLVDGFAACERTRLADELPYDVTAIVADNLSARRLLERGSSRLAGVPVYRPLADFVTLVIPVGRRRTAPRPPSAVAPIDAIADCLQRNGRRFQFAPVWTAADLVSDVRCRGLHDGDFFVHRADGRVTACLARWDQRTFKQAVVRGYGGRLRRWRYAINLAAAVTGRPRLPRVGEPMRLGFLSHVAVDDDDVERLIELIDQARRHSAGLDYLALGLAATNPMLAAVEGRFAGHSYRSVLYLVHGPGAEAAVDELDDRVPHVEVATL